MFHKIAIDFLVFAFCPVIIGAIAFTYTAILTRPGQIFSGLYKFLDRTIGNESKFKNSTVLKSLFKIVIDCTYCNAGQIGLWFSIWHYGFLTFIWVPFALMSVFYSFIINKIEL